MRAELLPMVLDIEVARHKREVAEGFAALRKSLKPPKREPSPMEQYNAFRNITDDLRRAQMAYSPFNPMNQYMSGQNALAPYGLFGGLATAARYPYPFPG